MTARPSPNVSANVSANAGRVTVAARASTRAASAWLLLAVAPNSHSDAAKTHIVIHPSVPACTWERTVFRLKSTRSVPLRMPITTVQTNTTIATWSRSSTSRRSGWAWDASERVATSHRLPVEWADYNGMAAMRHRDTRHVHWAQGGAGNRPQRQAGAGERLTVARKMRTAVS